MLSELQVFDDPRRVGTGSLQQLGGERSAQQLLASESVGDASYSSERILLVAFCASCHAQVIRRVDMEGIELVVKPWEHRYPRSDHAVTRIEIEDPRAPRDL